MSFGRFFSGNHFYNILRQAHWKLGLIYREICWFLGIKRIVSTNVLPVDPVLQYVQKRTCKFLETFQYTDTSSYSLEKYNTNIDSIIYIKPDFFETLLNPHNLLEKIWKRRILIENTPRGNIFMYYDIFKQGFAYYSDQSGVPYKILNAVAMKYVIVFLCRDFFLDDSVLPEGIQSPLLNVFVEDNEEEKRKKREKINALKMNLENAPFAKFKTYQNTPKKSGNSSSETVNEKGKEFGHGHFLSIQSYIGLWTYLHRWLTSYLPLQKKNVHTPDVENNLIVRYKKEKVVNKFINLGHTNNFHPLSATKSTVVQSSTNYDSMFSQVHKISYKDFVSREKDIEVPADEDYFVCKSPDSEVSLILDEFVEISTHCSGEAT